MAKIFNKKKNPKITFEFENVDSGFTITVYTEGDLVDDYVYGLKTFIDEKIEQANKNKKNNGKNRRK
jgi:hypothetical protein